MPTAGTTGDTGCDVDFGFWEGGLSWIPALGERLDREYLEHSGEFGDLDQLPSKYLSESYYGTQPLPEEATEMVSFEGLIEAQKAKILEDNARELFGL